MSVIDAAALGRRLDGVAGIGRGERGTNRLAWTPEDAAAAAWFAEQAAGLGLAFARDAAGNLWATPPEPGPWWACGSHLDSVRDGGAFDGALGVAAAFEVAAASRRAVAVISFADEEGARFNTPTFGSRALAGTLDVDAVLPRADDDGVRLADAMRGAGVDPDGLADAPAALGRLRGLVELHIDQSRDVAGAGAPAGVVSALAARLRLRATFSGAADHAGTTPRSDRRDALAAAARLIVAADQLGAREHDMRTTAGRILVEPNALTSIPAHVTLWLDARSAAPATVERWLATMREIAAELAAGTGVDIALAVESQAAGTTFDADLRARLRAAAPAPCPEVLCYAGHDAGVLAARIPAAMVLVRNRSGVSHAAAENVELDDAAAGATLILMTLEDLP